MAGPGNCLGCIKKASLPTSEGAHLHWGELSSETLLRFLLHSVLPSRETSWKILQQVVVPEVERILQGVSEADPRFDCTFLRSRSYLEELKGSEPDEFQFLVPLLKVPKLSRSPDDFVYVTEPLPDASEVAVVLTSEAGPSLYREPGADLALWQRPDLSLDIGDPEMLYTKNPAKDPAAYSKVCAVLNAYSPPGPARCNGAKTCLFAGQVTRILMMHVCDVISQAPGKVKVQQMQQDASAVTLTICWKNINISVDLVPVIKDPFNEWSLDWLRPGKLSPLAFKLADIKNTGVDLVAKHKMFWSYSFSNIERVLLEKIDKDGVQRWSLWILKKVMEELWKPKFWKNALVSHHLTTVLFWACQEYPYHSQWQDLAESFKRLVDKLLYFLRVGKLPHYFLGDRVNLFNEEKKFLNNMYFEVLQFRGSPMVYFQQTV